MGTTIINGVLHKMIDLPGAYSLNHRKVDERITYETLIGAMIMKKNRIYCCW